jgi:uracil-DNA glycosylase family 4
MKGAFTFKDVDMVDRETLRRQLEGHLESLRAAGVEWLPRGQALLPSASSTPAGLAPRAVPSRAATVVAAPASASIPQVAAPAPAAAPPVSDAAGIAQRRQALTMLAEEIKSCMRCPELASTRTQTVFAELCFVGEAPGADEDAQGLPFVGAAGQLLNKIIAAMGLKRDEVYICNILKCRPPGNRTPLPDEAAHCRGFLDRQLELVQPRFIVALGGCAATNLLNTQLSIGKLRGRFHDYRGIPVLCTYHPAYLLPHRSPEKKREVWDDMKMVLKAMGREVPK